jgi:ABC-type lipoprotein export system ATPase subunit
VALVEICGIAKAFPKARGVVSVLRGADARIEPGCFAAFSGPSGCGKSTLLLIAGALLRPDAGTVTVGGEDLLALPRRLRGRRMAQLLGFVFQQFHLLPYLTVEENIRSAAIALPAGGSSAADVEELMERFGISSRSDHLPGRLSVGEQQRTALARALVNRPKVLLADEPTGNLDPDNAAEALAALAGFAQAGGTVVMVTHNPDVARRADRRWLITDGRLVED